MSDTFEHTGWSTPDAPWDVPEATPATKGGPGRPTSPRRRLDLAALVIVAVVLVGVLSMTLGIQHRRPPTAAGAGSASASAVASAVGLGPVVDKVDDSVVNINTTLGYQDARAAGTGVVLTSSGQILTNNHVIEGSTRITVTLATTGKTYTAAVVGTYPTEDVAVLQLKGASNLKAVAISSTTAKIGDAVVAMGNAGGAGGAPVVATGRVIALDQTITATNEGGGDARRLSDLIQVSASIQSGDSGGPLANGAGEVIGINTAASVGGGRFRSTATTGYAIPIAKAMSAVKQINAGIETELVHLGLRAFLGVQLAPLGTGGALVAGIESGTPAAAAGLVAGDTIISVDRAPVVSAAALSHALGAHKPGDKVVIGWTTASGQSRSTGVSLATGPAD